MNKVMRKKILIVTALVGVAILAFYIFNNGGSLEKSQETKENEVSSMVESSNKPQFISSNPEDFAIISPTQTIELMFNQPIENKGELKLAVDPNFEYQIELSGDRKTAKITPATPLQAGSGFTLFIKPGSKFDEGKSLENETVLHFRTISYQGV